MEYVDILEGSRIFPGEYLFYKPINNIVICGAYDSKNKIVKALHNGKLIKDKINNFQKIKLSKEEHKSKRKAKKTCGSCKKR